MRRIVSAAVKLRDGRVIMCVRHMDHTFFKALGISLETPPTPENIEMIKGHEDGFVDNGGEFLSREEAWPIASVQQVLIDEDWQRGRLHSEHLY